MLSADVADPVNGGSRPPGGPAPMLTNGRPSGRNHTSPASTHTGLIGSVTGNNHSMNESWTSDSTPLRNTDENDRAKPTPLIVPKSSPNAPQLTIVGLYHESRHEIGLAVARSVGRPFIDSKLLVDTNEASDQRDVVADEIGSACRVLHGKSRVVLACGVDVFDVAPGENLDDSSGDDRRIDESQPDMAREATELLTAAWIVWIDRRTASGDEAGTSTSTGIEVESVKSEAQRRRASRWANHRVDATDLSPDELVDAILDGWAT